MRKKQKVKINGRGGGIRATIYSVIITLILILLMSLAVKKEYISEDNIKASLIVINIIAAIICGVVSGCGNNKLVVSIIAATAYSAIIIFIGFALNGTIGNIGSIMLILTMTVVISALTSRINLVKSNKRLHKMHKK